MKKLLLHSIIGLLTFVLLYSSSAAAPTVLRFHGPESANDTRYTYHWALLRAALEVTKPAYGDFELLPAELAMTQTRQMLELESEHGGLSVMIRVANRQLEERLTPVRVPIDKGLIGYRVFLIRKQDQDRFSAITTLADLKKLTVCQGQGWFDVKVFQYNGIQTEGGSSYDGLFAMLMNQNCDYFSRGIAEVIDEYEQRRAKYPDMVIEQSLLLYYDLPFYFYFAKSTQGQALAKRVSEGLAQLQKNGSYDKIFYAYHQKAIDYHQLGKRRLLKLTNPFLTPETPLGVKNLWYNPLRSRI